MKLQAEKAAADLVIQELTPLESTYDSLALRDYLQGISSKTEVCNYVGFQRKVSMPYHTIEHATRSRPPELHLRKYVYHT